MVAVPDALLQIQHQHIEPAQSGRKGRREAVKMQSLRQEMDENRKQADGLESLGGEGFAHAFAGKNKKGQADRNSATLKLTPLA